MPRVRLTRSIEVPDPIRIARAARAPELGPRILFFSGGTALRDVAHELTQFTHRSIHLITPFDSGGSSAKLREAFGILSVGDLRNRLMALADTRLHGHPSVYRLFGHRLPVEAGEAGEAALRARLAHMVAGQDPLVAAIPEPLRRLVQGHLGVLARALPEGFDLGGASIGNLILAGGLLLYERDIDAVVFLFSRLVEARGQVRPVVDADLHLVADLADGRTICGQHRLTGKDAPALGARIEALRLSSQRDRDAPATVAITDRTRRLIESAELICFPMGSFYTSVMACLLPDGVAAAVRAAGCPKVYIPNGGEDPEQLGVPPHEAVRRLAAVGIDLDLVLIDSRRGGYPGGLDVGAIEAQGMKVLDLPLVTEPSAPHFDARTVAEVLVSLA